MIHSVLCVDSAVPRNLYIIVLELHANLQLHQLIIVATSYSIISTLPHWSQPIQINRKTIIITCAQHSKATNAIINSSSMAEGDEPEDDRHST